MIKGFFINSTLFIFILAVLSLTACLKAPETIKDVRDLEQNHLAYLPDQVKSRDLISLENQNRLAEDYNIIFFSVWHQREPFYALPAAVDADSKRFAANFGYGENKRKHTRDWYNKLLQNAALGNYPNALYPAITVRNSSLRALPTERPHFNKPGGDSDGWPFDNLQRSSVAANTPIFVCHLSADKTWGARGNLFHFRLDAGGRFRPRR